MNQVDAKSHGISVRIGVDFDNTIAGYDSLLHRLAQEAAWIVPDTPPSKRIIRDTVRLLPDGEEKWQTLQAAIYGTRMAEADCIEGVKAFFTRCRRHSTPVYIVSHKTPFAAAAPNGPDLQIAAWTWLEQQGFFEAPIALPREHVFFELSRAEKLARIDTLACTHFIDDLEETFREPAFPVTTEKLLFAPVLPEEPPPNCQVFTNWHTMEAYFVRNCWHG